MLPNDSAYKRIVEIAKELGIIQTDGLTDEQLLLLVQELLEHLGIVAEEI